MVKKKWKRICVNLLDEDYDNLRIVASITKRTVSGYVQTLIENDRNKNKLMAELVRKCQDLEKEI